jgi:hypothetical protein
MNTRSLQIGDPVVVDVRGQTFEATIRSFPPARDKRKRTIGIDPLNPKRVSYRFCSARNIKGRAEA